MIPPVPASFLNYDFFGWSEEKGEFVGAAKIAHNQVQVAQMLDAICSWNQIPYRWPEKF